MSLTIIPFNNPKLTVADTEAGLATGTAYECQLTTAELIATENMQTVPQTGCAPPSSIPGLPSWTLHLIWLQDWTAPGGGLSGYAKANQGQRKWYSLSIDHVGSPTVVAKGEAWVGAGGYGGQIGGPPLSADVNWPCIAEPDITTPAPAAAMAE